MKSSKRFKKLKASSVLESVIAITIISICVLVASVIYINVISHNSSIAYYNAIHTIKTLKIESIQLKDYEDNNYDYDDYSINKKIILNKSEKTVLLEWEVISGKSSTFFHDIIKYDEDK